MTDEEKVPVGKCPVHGVVTDDDVNFNFPAPATCDLAASEGSRDDDGSAHGTDDRCGHQLSVVGLETPSKIQQVTA